MSAVLSPSSFFEHLAVKGMPLDNTGSVKSGKKGESEKIINDILKNNLNFFLSSYAVPTAEIDMQEGQPVQVSEVEKVLGCSRILFTLCGEKLFFKFQINFGATFFGLPISSPTTSQRSCKE